ncbi:hypothetical protein LCGC14_0826950, partial [marine sediment metagenome]
MKRLAIIISLLICTTTSGFSPTYLSFNTGQISPLMEARIDFAKYRSSARTVENMLVTTQGPVFRRPGTKYIATQQDSTAIGRVISYEHSVDDAYVLLLEDQAMRFFRDGGQILNSVGTEILTGGSKPGTANLVVHWLLNDDEGTAVLDDNGGTHDATASTDTATLNVVGKVGTGAFDLDGQYTVALATHNDFIFTDGANDSAFSLACWAYVTEVNKDQVLLSKWKVASEDREWRLALSPAGNLYLDMYDVSTDVNSDRVAQWKLNDDAANKTVTDAVGTHHGATQTSNTTDLTETGIINACLDLRKVGSDAVVLDADSALLSFNGTTDSAMSIAAWVYVVEVSNPQTILSKHDVTTGSLDREWRFWLDPRGLLLFRIYDESANAFQTVRTRSVISTGWHFVCATYDGSGGTSASDGMTLYIDGESATTVTQNLGTYADMEDGATKVVIGASYGASGSLTNYWEEKLDNVMLFDIELTESSVTTLYNDGAGIEDLTVAHSRVWAMSDNAITNGWHFLASTYSAPADETAAADGIILYVDGAAIDSTATNNSTYTAMQSGTASVRIGSLRNSAGSANEMFWNDKMDEVSIFSDVLTSAEIASLHSTPPYEIETPYLTADLFDLDFIKSEDVMYIVHPDYEPRQLSRSGHTLWSIDALNIGTGPFQAENEDTDLTITPAGATYTADSAITLTAASDLFQPGQIGSIWRIEQVRATSQITGTFTANGNSISTPFFSGAYGFTTSGNSGGTITLMRSTNNGASWRPALTALTNTDFDNPAEIEEDGAIYRVVMSNYGSGSPTYTITITDNANKGVVRITGVQNSTDATATVITALVDGTATSNWREGYWSDFRGWPETVTI